MSRAPPCLPPSTRALLVRLLAATLAAAVGAQPDAATPAPQFADPRRVDWSAADPWLYRQCVVYVEQNRPMANETSTGLNETDFANVTSAANVTGLLNVTASLDNDTTVVTEATTWVSSTDSSSWATTTAPRQTTGQRTEASTWQVTWDASTSPFVPWTTPSSTSGTTTECNHFSVTYDHWLLDSGACAEARIMESSNEVLLEGGCRQLCLATVACRAFIYSVEYAPRCVLYAWRSKQTEGRCHQQRKYDYTLFELVRDCRPFADTWSSCHHYRLSSSPNRSLRLENCGKPLAFAGRMTVSACQTVCTKMEHRCWAVVYKLGSCTGYSLTPSTHPRMCREAIGDDSTTRTKIFYRQCP